MTDYLAPVVDGVKRYPLLVAGGVGALLLLGMLSKGSAKTPSGISEGLAGKMIDADVAKAQIDAQRSVANTASMAGMRAAIGQVQGNVAMAGIQAATDQFGIGQSTTQNREMLGTQKELGLAGYANNIDLANIDSVLQRSLLSSQLDYQRWLSNLNDQYSRWSLPKILDYNRSQDYMSLKMARATAPYMGAQNVWLARQGFNPMSSYGIGGSGITGGDISGMMQGIAALGSMVGGWFGGGGGGGMSGTATANSAMDAMAASSASSYGSLFGSSGGSGGFFG